jgi:hypothetical protein
VCTWPPGLPGAVRRDVSVLMSSRESGRATDPLTARLCWGFAVCGGWCSSRYPLLILLRILCRYPRRTSLSAAVSRTWGRVLGTPRRACLAGLYLDLWPGRASRVPTVSSSLAGSMFACFLLYPGMHSFLVWRSGRGSSTSNNSVGRHEIGHRPKIVTRRALCDCGDCGDRLILTRGARCWCQVGVLCGVAVSGWCWRRAARVRVAVVGCRSSSASRVVSRARVRGIAS